MALVGEPTSRVRLGDTVKIGRRGSLNAFITLHGKQGHSAYPQRADNPVHRLVRVLHRLTAEPLDDGSEGFEPSTLQVTGFDVGNTATNVIPAEARAMLNIRFNDRHTGASLTEMLHAALRAEGARYELRVSVSGESFRTPPGPFVDAPRPRRGARHRRAAGARHRRRHLGRPLHRPLLPGGGARRRRRPPCTRWTSACRWRSCAPRRAVPHRAGGGPRLSGAHSAPPPPPPPSPPLRMVIEAGLRGVFMLARGQAHGAMLIEDTPEGAARSFWAAAICLPGFLALMLLDWADDPPGGGRRLRARWCSSSPMPPAGPASRSPRRRSPRLAGRGAEWPHFIAAWNWANVVQYLLLLAVSLPPCSACRDRWPRRWSSRPWATSSGSSGSCRGRRCGAAAWRSRW